MRTIPLPDTLDVPIPYITERQVNWSTSFSDGAAYLATSPIAWAVAVVVALAFYRLLRSWFRWAHMVRALVATAISLATMAGYLGVTSTVGDGIGVQPFSWSTGTPKIKHTVNQPALEYRVISAARTGYGDRVFDAKGNFKKGCTLKTIDTVGRKEGVAQAFKIAAYCDGKQVPPKG